jgi:hypothetical protein
MIHIPVRMFWNASSTLLASRAEVSIKERLFSPGQQCQRPTLSDLSITKRLTGKLLGLLGRHSPQMPQITLVSDQHNNNVTVSMIP